MNRARRARWLREGTGHDIGRFDDFSPGGGYWQDGGDSGTTGQVSLWITDICLDML